VYDLSGRIGVVESDLSSCAVDAGFRSRTGKVIESGGWGWSRNIGEKVNSSHSDGSPDLTDDGTKLYFHSNRQGGLGGHDIYICLRDGEEWHPPVNMGLPVNSRSHEFSPSLSSSGDSLYFASDRPGSLGKCDIWITVKIQGCCSMPVNLGPVVNSIYDERSPEISNDGMTLFFESDRPGGFGETDIWFCEWDGSGWSSPVNAGPRINTPSFEKNPSLSDSDQILCFDSNKLGGMGMADIYFSIREGSGWKVAQNLGWHVNSSSSDAEPAMSADGLILLFSSTRPGGFGMSDIFVADSTPDRDSDRGHEFIVPGIVKPMDTAHQVIP
jgi:Tol biopolymer transport system component